MGGRGSSSGSRSAAVGNMKRYLIGLANDQRLTENSTYANRERARLAGVAADLAGTDREAALRRRPEVAALVQEMGGSASSVHHLRNVLNGDYSGQYGASRKNVESLAAGGFTLDEVAAVTMYDRWLLSVSKVNDW